MLVDKGATKVNACRAKMLYYENARSGMFDLLQSLSREGVDKILLPGYIGWSPKEGSGIFDPINSIEGLDRQYYKMLENLEIDQNDLFSKAVSEKTVVLVVNYFGFRDSAIEEITAKLKYNGVWVIEDNAHGLYTYYKFGRTGADATFFSLHKMLPLEKGGAVLLINEKLTRLQFSASEDYSNMFEYDFGEIARIRTANYLKLDEMIRDKVDSDIFVPLKSKEAILSAVPQTYPVLIRMGNRDQIYELMNERGYGVVSLYHTLIPELREKEFERSQTISRHILNLPVHQDVNDSYYREMLDNLLQACRETTV